MSFGNCEDFHHEAASTQIEAAWAVHAIDQLHKPVFDSTLHK
jgi:hypothetical protein